MANTTEIFCAAEKLIVGPHSHILKILAAETELENAEITMYFRHIKCKNSKYNSIFAFTFKKVKNLSDFQYTYSVRVCVVLLHS